MRVRVEVTVEVDAEAWAVEYGIDESEVRDDFRLAATSAIHELAARDRRPEEVVS